MFLAKIEECAPDVVGDLRARVQAPFDEAWEETTLPPSQKAPSGPLGSATLVDRPPPWSLRHWERGEWDDLASEHEVVTDLKDAVTKWGRRWNLTEPWLMDVALSTVHTWSLTLRERRARASEAEDHLQSVGAAATQLGLDDEERHDLRAQRERDLEAAREYGKHLLARFRKPTFVDYAGNLPFRVQSRFDFEHPGWVPIWHTWQHYEREIRERFEGDLARHIKSLKERFNKRLRGYREEGRERAENWADKVGAKRTRRKRIRSSSDPYLHFEWAVLHQCEGWTLRRIADEYHRGEKTVQEAIREVRKLIGLSHPPRGRGRG